MKGYNSQRPARHAELRWCGQSQAPCDAIQAIPDPDSATAWDRVDRIHGGDVQSIHHGLHNPGREPEPTHHRIGGRVMRHGEIGEHAMLTDGIAAAHRQDRARVAASSGVQEVITWVCDRRNAALYLYRTAAATWLANEALGEATSGPLVMILTASTTDEMLQLARSLHGQLTCTLHLDNIDTDLACSLPPILERKAGLVLANGFPTGVEVTDAMVYGSPCPASTRFGHTSIGTLAIRWLRPICSQKMPGALLRVPNN